MSTATARILTLSELEVSLVFKSDIVVKKHLLDISQSYSKVIEVSF